MKRLGLIGCLLVALLLSACRYAAPQLDDDTLTPAMRDSLVYLQEHHYTLGSNFEVYADSVDLVCLPLRDCYSRLRHGQRVVVAEFAIHPADSVDSVWVKLAHTQEVQGWMRECELKQTLVPTDILSQCIYLFSRTHASYFVIVCALFMAYGLLRIVRRKQLKIVYFDDIDSFYPLLLCLLLSTSATLYETMQVFAPDTWEHFYYNPTLSPLHVPLLLGAFLVSLWLILILLLAVLDELFRQLSPALALFYLLGLATVCIFCYFFFIWTTRIYLGYPLLLLFVWQFVRRMRTTLRTPLYRCGRCGHRLTAKGICSRCGAENR